MPLGLRLREVRRIMSSRVDAPSPCHYTDKTEERQFSDHRMTTAIDEIATVESIELRLQIVQT